MFWNIAIAVILAALAALVSGLAGQLAATKRWHKWLFWGSGVVMVSLIGIQTYRNEMAQSRLQDQLDTIQKQTAQPPKIEVKIPPQPQPLVQRPRAMMALSRDTSNDGLVILRDPRFPQNGWAVNVSCKNIGTVVTAKKVSCASSGNRISAHNGFPDNKTLQEHWDEFSKWLSKENPQGVDLEPGKNVWGSGFLNMTDVDPDLNTGAKVIWVGGAILYSDAAGTHKKEFCMWAQPPFDPPNTAWHFCAIGHNKEVY
jgi:hypothetical protein